MERGIRRHGNSSQAGARIPQRKRPLRAAAAAVIAPLLAAGLAGCGAAYEGPYDEDFRSGLEAYIGETVTISADVLEVITPASFTVSGTEAADVDPLLIVAQHGAVVKINAGVTVDVTGLLRRGLDPEAVEEELGIELDNEELENWRSEPYIQATEIETTIDDG